MARCVKSLPHKQEDLDSEPQHPGRRPSKPAWWVGELQAPKEPRREAAEEDSWYHLHMPAHTHVHTHTYKNTHVPQTQTHTHLNKIS